MARYTRPTVPADWHVTETARVRGAVLVPGRVVRITGERGAYAFLRHVTNVRTGAAWLDVRDLSTGALRAFHADRVRSVKRGRPVPCTPVAGRTVVRTAAAA